MKVDKTGKEIIEQAITDWESNGQITTDKAEELRNSISLKQSSQQLAQYFFIIAISCVVLAFGAIFIDEKILEQIKNYFSLSNIFISITFLGLAIAWFVYCRKRLKNTASLGYEMNMVLGALLLLISLVYACKDIGFGTAHSGFLIITSILLGILAGYFKSKALWIATILALMGWYGAFTNAFSHDNLFLGMNYPLRFAVFGALIIGFSFLQDKIKQLSATSRITYLAGFIILFTALWGLSIFGNYAHLDEWSKVRQTQVIIYALIFALISGAAFYLGIKYKDDTTRDLALVFLLINLYTRYFEFFWDGMNKGIFFCVLAISFWALGRWIEKRKKSSAKKIAI